MRSVEGLIETQRGFSAARPEINGCRLLRAWQHQHLSKDATAQLIRVDEAAIRQAFACCAGPKETGSSSTSPTVTIVAGQRRNCLQKDDADGDRNTTVFGQEGAPSSPQATKIDPDLDPGPAVVQ